MPAAICRSITIADFTRRRDGIQSRDLEIRIFRLCSKVQIVFLLNYPMFLAAMNAALKTHAKYPVNE